MVFPAVFWTFLEFSLVFLGFPRLFLVCCRISPGFLPNLYFYFSGDLLFRALLNDLTFHLFLQMILHGPCIR